MNGRGERCPQFGGTAIDRAVSKAFLQAISPAASQAVVLAQANFDTEHNSSLKQLQLRLERARYQAERAERQYRAVEPENRLVARSLEAKWEQGLEQLAQVEAEMIRHEHARPKGITPQELERIGYLAADLERVWNAPSTTARDRKELLRTLIEEVNIRLGHEDHKAVLTLRWKGGLFTDLEVSLSGNRQPTIRTDEKTVDLVRRLAVHYKDAVIAGILNRQGRTTARGHRFTTGRVASLRYHWKIPRYQPDKNPPDGDLVSVRQAAKILGMNTSTIHRWLNEGFIAGEQLTPGAPWRIRMNDELRARFVEDTPEGFVPMIEATKLLGVSRQTVLQRVKEGKLDAVLVHHGRRKGLRIKILDQQPRLFEDFSQ